MKDDMMKDDAVNSMLDTETQEAEVDHNAAIPDARDFINELVKDMDA